MIERVPAIAGGPLRVPPTLSLLDPLHPIATAELSGLREHGIQVIGRTPIVMPANRHNAKYLDTKRTRSGHWLLPEPTRPRPAPGPHAARGRAGRGA